MDYQVAHSCPQCGAGIEFAETDHFLVCPYCAVRSFMYSERYFRFRFEPQVAGATVVYAPYLHFRGNAFFTRRMEVDQKNLNLTALGLPSQVLPPNLGWKNQTHKLRLLDGGVAGTFLRFDARIETLLGNAINAATGGKTANHMFIGEALSLIYFPLVMQGASLVDGITGGEVALTPPGFSFAAFALEEAPASDLKFMGALCPDCGADLEGEGRSLVLTCGGCDSAWEPLGGRWVRRTVRTVRGKGAGTVFVPFWRMAIRTHAGPPFDSYVAFNRLTGQISPNRPDLDAPMIFFSPAFKIAPQTFSRLCGRLTVAQHPFPTQPELPRHGRYPITLSAREAAETIPLTVAELAFNKRDVFPQLPSIRVEVLDSSLLYLPFSPDGMEMVQPELRLGVNTNALDFGRYM